MNDTNMTGSNDKRSSASNGAGMPSQNAPLHSTTDQEKRAHHAPENAGARKEGSSQGSSHGSQGNQSGNRSGQMQHTQERDKFQADFSSFMSDVENLLSRGSTLSGEALDASKAELSARLQSFKNQWSDLSEKTSENATHVVAVCQDYVRARPLQSVGIALGVGALIGFLLRGNGGRRETDEM
ncbi:DUF883 family protein [Chitinimonas lacunae]|uniref:YqjD family protein n=1 Tax=Chitinimonas lacunae TaxID=1963018 RepID=A0ABV8MJU5_9NEIS